MSLSFSVADIKEQIMKKSFVLLLVAVTMMISGCHNREEKAELPSKESAPTEEKSEEVVETVEEADVKEEEVAESEKNNIYKEQMEKWCMCFRGMNVTDIICSGWRKGLI